MLIQSYAKVNLYLRIGKKLKSGYHNIQSLMQLVQIHDNLTFEKLPSDEVKVASNNRDLSDENNLAHKAALMLKAQYKVKKGIRIYVEKNIPISAGLGGGSSNAAHTLVVLNKLWGLKIPQNKLIDMAAKIGSDVPFFIHGKTAVVEGFGEKIMPLTKSNSLNVVLVNPGIKVSTTDAYKWFDKNKTKIECKAKLKDLTQAIERKDFKAISRNLHNDFESIIEKKHPIIREIKTNFRRFDALNSVLVGSGPTVLGLFESIYTAREAYFKLKDLYPFVYLTKTF